MVSKLMKQTWVRMALYGEQENNEFHKVSLSAKIEFMHVVWRLHDNNATTS